MENYDLNLLRSGCTQKQEDKVEYKHYKYYLESEITFNKPDYVAVIDLRNENPVLFYQNLNLSFLETNKDTICDVAAVVEPSQLSKILSADLKCSEFVSKNLKDISKTIFTLRFATLEIDGKKRSLIRNVRFIPRINKGTQHILILVSFYDVSNFLGVNNQPVFDFKFNEVNNTAFRKVLENLKRILNKQLTYRHELTQREFEILNLIGQGKTSADIANELNISKNTVNTHRQNLIKKFNVKNTASLLKEM
ncbi:response regulator transcription factor [Aestuariibaculum sediminum]|uniref:Helix-turn-helix transcriptional regulator n=1 Tax=Aestuariibaculum sediminum TaxID=2770637 RepID=A0A8J6Q0V8_9FLAO|nr:helix-turn-helix transcriptional regulator [Aestuariibaculum sediminum]MBD0830509.1 helix-turn-helix transcriptional regulator [Aestuariibaculum sediminum]